MGSATTCVGGSLTGRVPLRKFTPELVRSWHSTLATSAGQDQASKSYRLLRAILNTAVDDTRIGRNPCRIRGGDSENAAERPMVTTRTVLEMADLARYRYRALILLAGLGGLRTGESLGLHRGDVDPLRRTVWIRQQAQEITGLGRVEGRPKSDAGKRAVVLPAAAMEALEDHLAAFTGADPASVVFIAPGGLPARRAAVSEAWQEVKQLIGADPDLRLHDLRHHAARMMARMPGVTTKELMARIGHASPRAALIYQHATEERDEAIADYMDQQVAASRSAESGGLVIPLHRH